MKKIYILLMFIVVSLIACSISVLAYNELNITSAWLMDNTFTDKVAGLNNLTGTGTYHTNTTIKKFGNSTYFAASATATKTNTVGLGSGAGDYSYCTWMYMTVNSDLATMCNATSCGNAGQFWRFIINEWDNSGSVIQNGAESVTTANGLQSANVWKYYCMRFRASDKRVEVFVNNTLYMNGTLASLNIPANNTFGIHMNQGGAGSSSGSGYFEQSLFFNRWLSQTTITQLWNGGAGITTEQLNLTSQPPPVIIINNISFISQVPTTISTTTLFSTNVNVTYQYINQSVSLSSLFFNYTINSTQSCIVNTNGTCSINDNVATSKNYTSSGAIVNGTIASVLLGENDIYPLRQNFIGNGTNPTTSLTLGNNDGYIDEILNLSSTGNVNYYEIPIIITGNALAKVYYYNSSYDFSSSLLTNVNVVEIATLNNNTLANHTHGTYNHTVIPIALVNGLIGTVKLSGGGFIIYKPISTGTVTITTLQKSIRFNSSRLSGNSGLTWTSGQNTLASHLHQFSVGDQLLYNGCGTLNGTVTCNGTQSVKYLVSAQPPQPPVITNPFGQNNFTRFINITYLPSVNVSNASILFYNITLLNENNSLLYTLQSNNSLNLSFLFDTYQYNLSVNTAYKVRVLATDTNGYSAFDIESFQVVTNALLNVSVSSFNGTPINSFAYTINGLNFSSSTNSFVYDVVRGSTYTLLVNVSGYTTNTSIITISNSPNVYYNVSLYPFNSVFFQVYVDTLSNPLLSSNTSIVMNNGGSIQYNLVTNSTGGVFISNVASGTYTVTYSNSMFLTRQVIVTVSDNTFQFSNLFFSSGIPVLFNLKNTGGTTLQGVFCTVSQFNNGSLIIIQSALSDVSGRIQFVLNTSGFYSFNCSLSGFVSNIFSLNPVLFTSYDVPMSPIFVTSTLPTGYVSFSPSSFRRFQNVSFVIEFFSPYDSFINYTFNVSYPNGYIDGSGSQADGERFNRNFVVNGSGNVVIFYSWLLSNGVYQNFTFTYSVVNVLSNRTISSNQGNYGMLIGDMVLRDTIILIVLMGLGWLAFGFFGSLAMGGLTLGIVINSGGYTASQSLIFGAVIIIIFLLIVFRGRQ